MGTEEILMRKLRPISQDGDGHAEFAAQVGERLGYTNLANTEVADEQLKRCLAELEIQPFTAESVTKYKAQAVAEFEAAAVKRGEGELSDTSLRWFAASVICGLALLLATALASPFVGNPAAFLVFVGAFVVAGALAMVGLLIPREAPYRWYLRQLERYEGPVPEFALQTALDIKKRLPEARFWVDELRRNAPTDEPFLSVSLHDSGRYYLEVWNEPGFTQKRIA
jgi:hypothetical protein